MELKGVIENIVFKNNENGYTVAKFKYGKNNTIIVGYMPYVQEGQNLKVEGEWTQHFKFGKQFKVEVCEEVVPNSISGIEKYLSSGVISGIGPVTAKKIVEHFGDETLHILDNDVNRLREIKGIGDKKIKVIIQSYSKQKEIRDIMVFLQTYGVSISQCVKIHKKYGSNSINVVKENPYRLTDDIRGIGFKMADKLARNLGIEKDSPFRIQSGIKYVINEFCTLGNTYMPYDKLIKEAADILEVSEENVDKGVYECALEGKIKIETIEEEKCVFTIPFYYSELSVTKKVIDLTVGEYKKLKIDIEKEINKFEEKNNISLAQSQKEAIIGAVNYGIEIITGGPGTGKTTIINCIIDIFENAGLNVYMAAPTGRAAKRMAEATGREAKTIHRLLELGYGEQDSMEFFKNEQSPLDCDVLIIDEASMIDIMLMNNLLKAINYGTRIIIVGDVDQLPSVGPGNVLRDIIESKCVKVVRLKEIFRQSKESMIIINAHKINNGEMPILNKKNNDFYFMRCEERDKILSTIIELINVRLPKFNNEWNNINDIQILSPMRRGVLGVENFNIELQNVLNPRSNDKKEKKFHDTVFRIGDKIMQTKNNYSIKWNKLGSDDSGMGVFNGDVGYICDIDEDENVTVIFEDDKLVQYDNTSLDEITLAYAITIHKSQGSEFPVVIIPMFMGPPLLMNKNLLYTGITRAKKLVIIVGSEKALSFMIKNDRSFERYSALRWRITRIMDV